MVVLKLKNDTGKPYSEVRDEICTHLVGNKAFIDNNIVVSDAYMDENIVTISLIKDDNDVLMVEVNGSISDFKRCYQ